MNGDNAPDLVVSSIIDDNISVLLNTGNGSFAAPQTPGHRRHHAGRRALHRRGHRRDKDLFVIRVLFDATPDELVIFGNDGAGNFSIVASHPIGQVDNSFTTPGALASGDIDGDGLPDALLSGRMLINQDIFNFAPPALFTTNGLPVACETVDLDADDHLDLVFTNLELTRSARARNRPRCGFHRRCSSKVSETPPGAIRQDLSPLLHDRASMAPRTGTAMGPIPNKSPVLVLSHRYHVPRRKHGLPATDRRALPRRRHDVGGGH